MQTKLLIGLLSVAVIVVTCLAASSWSDASAKTASTTSNGVINPAQNQTGTNNATNPDDIPDRLAYMLLFRFLSNPLRSQDENVRKQTRAFLKQARLGKKCNTCPTAERTDDADVDVIAATANEFQERVGVLDQQAVQLKRQNRIAPNPEITSQLTQLQQQKEATADSITASLQQRLSNHARQEMRRFIQEHVKRNIQRQ